MTDLRWPTYRCVCPRAAMEGGTGIAAHENLFLVECDADGSIAATACCWSTPSHAEVRKQSFLRDFNTTNDQFTKTGSGQT